jgi:hypothetical protein
MNMHTKIINVVKVKVEYNVSVVAVRKKKNQRKRDNLSTMTILQSLEPELEFLKSLWGLGTEEE